jgi:hypothetical protein
MMIEPRINEREERRQRILTARLMEQKPIPVLTEMGKRRRHFHRLGSLSLGGASRG